MAESGGHSRVATGYVGIHADHSALPAELAHVRAMFKESFQNIAEIAAGIMAAAGLRSMLDSLKEAVGGFISVNAQFEQYQTTLAQVFHSQSMAMKMVDEVHELAGKIAMPMQNLIDATVTFKKFGFETKAVLPMLHTIADAAAMFPKSMGEGMGKIVSAFSRIQASGTVTSRNMLMLFRAGIPAADILATKLGVTKAKIDEMLKAGKLTSGLAIPALLAGMKERFGGQAERVADLWSGLISRLHHSWEYFLKQVGKPIFDVAKTGLKAIVEWFHDDTAKEWIQTLRGGIEYVINLVKSALQSAWMPVVVRIGKAALTAMSFVGSIEMAILVSGKLGAILSAVLSPMGLLTAGIMTLSYMLQQALDGPHGKELRATLYEILAIGREIGLHLMKAFGEFFGWVQGKWGATFGNMQGASDSLFGTIVDWFKYITTQVAIFSADFGLTWDYIKESASLAFLIIKDKFNAFVEVGGAKMKLMWMRFQDAAESAFETIKPFAYAFLAAMTEITKQISENMKAGLVNAAIEAKAYIQAWAQTSHLGSVRTVSEARPDLVKKIHNRVRYGKEERAAAQKEFDALVEIDKKNAVTLRKKEILKENGGLEALPGFNQAKVAEAWGSGKAGAAAPPETDAEKARKAARKAEMERLNDLKASPSTTDEEKKRIQVVMDGIKAAMDAEREKQKLAQAAHDASKEFWAEVKRRQQPLANPEPEGKDGKAAAGKGKAKGKGKGKEFGIVDVAQFAKDLQMAIQKSDAEEATEEMAKVIKGAQAAGGNALNVVITDMPDMVARCV